MPGTRPSIGGDDATHDASGTTAAGAAGRLLLNPQRPKQKAEGSSGGGGGAPASRLPPQSPINFARRNKNKLRHLGSANSNASNVGSPIESVEMLASSLRSRQVEMLKDAYPTEELPVPVTSSAAGGGGGGSSASPASTSRRFLPSLSSIALTTPSNATITNNNSNTNTASTRVGEEREEESEDSEERAARHTASATTTTTATTTAAVVVAAGGGSDALSSSSALAAAAAGGGGFTVPCIAGPRFSTRAVAVVGADGFTGGGRCSSAMAALGGGMGGGGGGRRLQQQQQQPLPLYPTHSSAPPPPLPPPTYPYAHRPQRTSLPAITAGPARVAFVKTNHTAAGESADTYTGGSGHSRDGGSGKAWQKNSAERWWGSGGQRGLAAAAAARRTPPRFTYATRMTIISDDGDDSDAEVDAERLLVSGAADAAAADASADAGRVGAFRPPWGTSASGAAAAAPRGPLDSSGTGGGSLWAAGDGRVASNYIGEDDVAEMVSRRQTSDAAIASGSRQTSDNLTRDASYLTPTVATAAASPAPGTLVSSSSLYYTQDDPPAPSGDEELYLAVALTLGQRARDAQRRTHFRHLTAAAIANLNAPDSAAVQDKEDTPPEKERRRKNNNNNTSGGGNYYYSNNGSVNRTSPWRSRADSIYELNKRTGSFLNRAKPPSRQNSRSGAGLRGSGSGRGSGLLLRNSSSGSFLDAGGDGGAGKGAALPRSAVEETEEYEESIGDENTEAVRMLFYEHDTGIPAVLFSSEGGRTLTPTQRTDGAPQRGRHHHRRAGSFGSAGSLSDGEEFNPFADVDMQQVAMAGGFSASLLQDRGAAAAAAGLSRIGLGLTFAERSQLMRSVDLTRALPGMSFAGRRGGSRSQIPGNLLASAAAAGVSSSSFSAAGTSAGSATTTSLAGGLRRLQFQEQCERLLLEQLELQQSPVPGLLDELASQLLGDGGNYHHNGGGGQGEGSRSGSSTAVAADAFFELGDSMPWVPEDERAGTVHLHFPLCLYTDEMLLYRTPFLFACIDPVRPRQEQASPQPLEGAGEAAAAAATAQDAPPRRASGMPVINRHRVRAVLERIRCEKEAIFERACDLHRFCAEEAQLIEDEAAERAQLAAESGMTNALLLPSPPSPTASGGGGRRRGNTKEAPPTPMDPLYYSTLVLLLQEQTQQEALALREEGIGEVHDQVELTIIAYYVSVRLAEDEHKAWSKLMRYNNHCMSLAARRYPEARIWCIGNAVGKWGHDPKADRRRSTRYSRSFSAISLSRGGGGGGGGPASRHSVFSQSGGRSSGVFGGSNSNSSPNTATGSARIMWPGGGAGSRRGGSVAGLAGRSGAISFNESDDENNSSGDYFNGGSVPAGGGGGGGTGLHSNSSGVRWWRSESGVGGGARGFSQRSRTFSDDRDTQDGDDEEDEEDVLLDKAGRPKFVFGTSGHSNSDSENENSSRNSSSTRRSTRNSHSSDKDALAASLERADKPETGTTAVSGEGEERTREATPQTDASPPKADGEAAAAAAAAAAIEEEEGGKGRRADNKSPADVLDEVDSDGSLEMDEAAAAMEVGDVDEDVERQRQRRHTERLMRSVVPIPSPPRDAPGGGGQSSSASGAALVPSRGRSGPPRYSEALIQMLGTAAGGRGEGGEGGEDDEEDVDEEEEEDSECSSVVVPLNARTLEGLRAQRIRYLGPLDSPFCSYLKFVEMEISLKAEAEGRARIGAEERAAWQALCRQQRHQGLVAGLMRDMRLDRDRVTADEKERRWNLHRAYAAASTRLSLRRQHTVEGHALAEHNARAALGDRLRLYATAAASREVLRRCAPDGVARPAQGTPQASPNTTTTAADASALSASPHSPSSPPAVDRTAEAVTPHFCAPPGQATPKEGDGREQQQYQQQQRALVRGDDPLGGGGGGSDAAGGALTPASSATSRGGLPPPLPDPDTLYRRARATVADLALCSEPCAPAVAAAASETDTSRDSSNDNDDGGGRQGNTLENKRESQEKGGGGDDAEDGGDAVSHRTGGDSGGGGCACRWRRERALYDLLEDELAGRCAVADEEQRTFACLHGQYRWMEEEVFADMDEIIYQEQLDLAMVLYVFLEESYRRSKIEELCASERETLFSPAVQCIYGIL